MDGAPGKDPMPERTVDTTRNPEAMTVAERRAEVASILARGLVRSARLARARTPLVLQEVLETGESGLDLSGGLPLSVAQRPAG